MSEVKRWAHTVAWEGLQISAAHMAIYHGGEYVMYDDYAALEAENARLVERAGYLVEFAQQMARQQGEPYYQKLAKAALKKWSGL